MNTLKSWRPKVYDYIEGTVGYFKYSTFKKGVGQFTKLLTYLLNYIYSIVSAGARIPQVSKTAKEYFLKCIL